MKVASKFSPYRRSAFLESVDAKHRPLAQTLCTLLESTFDPKDIQIYSGFPIVVRDMEWIAGFAMRANICHAARAVLEFKLMVAKRFAVRSLSSTWSSRA